MEVDFKKSKIACQIVCIGKRKFEKEVKYEIDYIDTLDHQEFNGVILLAVYILVHENKQMISSFNTIHCF